MLRDGSGVPALAPAPTLDDLRALADRAQLTGLAVDLVVDGLDGRNELPGGVGQSVYRIVQEALTNVVKHASAATCGSASPAATATCASKCSTTAAAAKRLR